MKETKWKENFYRAWESVDDKYLKECEEFLETSRKRKKQRKVFFAAVSAAAVLFLLFLGGKYLRSSEEGETEQGSIWAAEAERPAVMETSDQGESLEILTAEDFRGSSFTAEESGAVLSIREVCRYTDRTEIYFSFEPSEPFPAESLESFLWEIEDEIIFYDMEGNQRGRIYAEIHRDFR